MLDVHPPHHPTHTWKDFFVHIATIVVGLLIAVALEQTVEWVHHRREVRETREALRKEREDNDGRFAWNIKAFKRQTAMLQNNLLLLTYLQQHPGTPEEDLPGILMWGAQNAGTADATWKAALQSNVVDLMPKDEVATDAEIYRYLEDIDTAEKQVWYAVSKARAFEFIDPNPSHLGPAGLAEEIKLTEDVMEAHFRHGVAMSLIAGKYKDFGPLLTRDDLNGLGIAPRSAEDKDRLKRAQALSEARVKDAMSR